MIYRDQLEAVYRLIERPEAWTKQCFARRADGVPIDDTYLEYEGIEATDANMATHHRAACWCLYGAAYKCGIFKDREYEAALGESDVAHFNDTHTHAEVLALLKAAIDRAPVRESAS